MDISSIQQWAASIIVLYLLRIFVGLRLMRSCTQFKTSITISNSLAMAHMQAKLAIFGHNI